MGLSIELNNVHLCFPCKYCNHAHVKAGRWFVTQSAFVCDGCGHTNRITYQQKMELFERARSGVNSSRRRTGP